MASRRPVRMTTSWLLLVGLALAALWGTPALASAVTPAEVTARSQALGVPFIENRGQADARVALYARTFGGTVFVTRSGEIVYALPAATAGEADARQTLALREVLIGRKAGSVRGEGQAVTRVSDFTVGRTRRSGGAGCRPSTRSVSARSILASRSA